MLKKITSTVFNSAVAVLAAAAAAWLALTGHTLQIGGLLLALGAILAAVIFAIRVAEGFGSDRLSIWVGPLRSIRGPSLTKRDEFREAA
ncbi:MAG TPA: hypothetical protein VH639_02740 [Bryobacteraceae bacterium]|jgi:hypothetical protein